VCVRVCVCMCVRACEAYPQSLNVPINCVSHNLPPGDGREYRDPFDTEMVPGPATNRQRSKVSSIPHCFYPASPQARNSYNETPCIIVV
jgi:hypothetical protein